MYPEFEVHKLNDLGIAKAQEIATVFDECLFKLSALCPTGRLFSSVKTDLERACFFAKKAMANLPENQQE